MTEPEFVPVEHDRFHRVQRDVFVRRMVGDCMTHNCIQVAEDGIPLGQVRPRLDICCQYGADVDVGEREVILAHAEPIRALLVPGAQVAPWFTDEVQVDDEYPSGEFVRTSVYQDGCVFLAHDKRGCGIHRAAIESGWDFRTIKPHICRLFPMSYESDALVVSDDFVDYDCADAAGHPTLYRITRSTLADVFGPDLVAALDRVEAALGATPADAAPLPAPSAPDAPIQIRRTPRP